MLTSRTRASSPSRWRQRALSTKYGNQVGDDYVYYTCDMIGEGMSSKVYKGIHIPTSNSVVMQGRLYRLRPSTRPQSRITG